MDRDELHRCAELSPFELRTRLVELARHRGERMMLNAGRGNPNWIALEPRVAFFALGAFALAEAQATALGPGLGGLPRKRGIATRLRAFLDGRGDGPGGELLRRGVDHACAAFGFDPDLLVGEWVDGVLGDHYPVPVRMLAHTESLVRAHLVDRLFGGDAQAGQFDWFAVEGASAGIGYVFQSLLHARLLAPGDRIALGVPIFTPYLDLTGLPEYGFERVEVVQDEAARWRYAPAQTDKLRDPRVKVFLAVNPSNPTAVAIDDTTRARIAQVTRERPDLILITDDVYAPFVDGFRSLAETVPLQTIVVYSFSKFWGATGWRLGVVGLHASNTLDLRLAAGAGPFAAAARARYHGLSLEPERLKFIDRMVADSRSVGLNHTAGLSSPQQVQMALFVLDDLLDGTAARRHRTRALVRSRFEQLYLGLGVEPPDDALQTHYYATLDIAALAAARFGPAFADWLRSACGPVGFVTRLAEDQGIVLLDGGGFEAPRMSVRVSLANLPDQAYRSIGRGIVALLEAYHARWKADVAQQARAAAP